jgi:predicted Rossmann-fold nucleotide-binding protein
MHIQYLILVSFLALGEAMAQHNYALVYGGGKQGIMGIVSSSVLASGGSVTGVTPHAMVRAGGEGGSGAQTSREAVKMLEGPNVRLCPRLVFSTY